MATCSCCKIIILLSIGPSLRCVSKRRTRYTQTQPEFEMIMMMKEAEEIGFWPKVWQLSKSLHLVGVVVLASSQVSVAAATRATRGN